MPPATKKAMLAKKQRASRGSQFNSGRLEDLQELLVDPTFIPDISEEDTVENHDDWCFSLLDSPMEIQEISEESEPEEVIEVDCGKRKACKVDSERLDLADNCAARAEQYLREFWDNFMKSVSRFNLLE